MKKITKILATATLLCVQTTIAFAQQPQSTSPVGCVSGNCQNGLGKMVSPKGAVFEGNFVNGIASGKGKMIYPDGNKYEGDFVGGKREGQGTFTLKRSGEVYTGTFVNGQLNGFGKYIDVIESYEGNWINGKRTGKGKLFLHVLGNIYEGDFVEGRFTGKGIYKYKDGSSYIGEFKNMNKEGAGKEFDKANKLIREGIWKNDVFIK